MNNTQEIVKKVCLDEISSQSSERAKITARVKLELKKLKLEIPDVDNQIEIRYAVCKASMPFESEDYFVFHILKSLTNGEISNSITPELEKQKEKKLEVKKPKIPYQEAYEWATELTSEQNSQVENFIWTKQSQNLLKRLQTTKRQLIAVVGLQGSGKTALLNALWSRLDDCFGFKWFGKDAFKQNLQERYDPAVDIPITELVIYVKDALGVNGVKKWIERHYPGNSNLIYEVEDVLRNIFKKRYEEVAQLRKYFQQMIPKKEIQKLRETKLKDTFRCSTLLIDLPDYDRNNRTQLIRDLNDIHTFWQELEFEPGDRKTNLVLFIQKELFSGHFFFGKMDVVEIAPPTVMDMVQAYGIVNKTKDGLFSTKPFQKEALQELAKLSRGIWRRFKKYIRICLDNFKGEEITIEDVYEWIDTEQLQRDMELELVELFPKNKELRNYAVILLHYIQQRGIVEQSELVKTVFGEGKAEEMMGSRILSKLEAYGYIHRTTHGYNQKIVSLKEAS